MSTVPEEAVCAYCTRTFTLGHDGTLQDYHNGTLPVCDNHACRDRHDTNPGVPLDQDPAKIRPAERGD